MPDGSQERVEYRQHRFRPPPGATELLVVRHGESAPATFEDPSPLADGRSDPPLAPNGHGQADLVARGLVGTKVAAIYVSNLRRTAETAAPLATALDLQPIVEPHLAEVCLGEWEGATFRKNVAEKHPLHTKALREQRWDVIPGAESNESLQARVGDAIRRIADTHADERVVVVTHGGVIGTIMTLATGARPFAFVGSDNGSLTRVVVDGDRWIVRSYNETAHLDS